MARIVIGSYMVRYPLGGMMSYVLQYLVGFRRLGHDVYFVEKAGYANACYDPTRDVMSDDCTFGVRATNDLLTRFELGDRWCFVDAAGTYLGLSRGCIEEIFRTADLFVDMGTHGAWLPEAAGPVHVLLDGEPGFTQMKMELRRLAGDQLPDYDHYYTAGSNVGTPHSTTPTAGRRWQHMWHPVVVDMFSIVPVSGGAPFTTVMNWQSHDRIEFGGRVYGQKDLEFEQVVALPRSTSSALEVAVSGRNAPIERLRQAGWKVSDAHAVTSSFDAFCRYIQASRGEFSVCKHIFVATHSGWFSDRSAAYLASGRPVVLQDTGFSDHLPSGEGLLAFRTAEEAVNALEEVEGNYEKHSRRARELAGDYLDASRVLKGMLDELGIQ